MSFVTSLLYSILLFIPEERSKMPYILKSIPTS